MCGDLSGKQDVQLGRGHYYFANFDILTLVHVVLF